jgi:hypothetical protein
VRVLRGAKADTVSVERPIPTNIEYAAAQLAGDLGRLEEEWRPYSKPDAIWHGCPGHEWERFDYTVNPHSTPPHVERITRCGKCGAPRCDTHDPDASNHGWEWMDDRQRQYWRCTLERHHGDEHDFLTGGTTETDE